MLSKQTNTLTTFFLKPPTPTESPQTAFAPEPRISAIGEKDIDAFYASLSPNERRAHEIARKSLGTSYDVRATHGFRNWLSKK